MRSPFRKAPAPIEPVNTPRKTRAFIVSSEGQVSHMSELAAAEIKKRDQQINEVDSWLAGDGLAAKPYSTESFYFFYESNVMVWRCCRQIATDVAGLGYSLQLREGMSENAAERKKIMTLLDQPNKQASFRTINEAFIIDWGVSGNSAFQIVRSRDDQIAEVYHMPTGALWAHTEGAKFCQKINDKKSWFARFGAGDNGARLALDPATGAPAPDDTSELANEIVFYHTYFPGSRWYGVPNMLPCTGEIITSIGIRDFNLGFFANHGMPAYVVKLLGSWDQGTEEDDDKTVDIVEDYFKSIKKPEAARSTLVLEIPEGCELQIDPISVKIEEGSFKVLKQLVDQDVLTAYSMPPYRIGIAVRAGSLAGNIAGELTTNYINGTVEPLQTDLEDIWSDQIFRDGMDCPSYRIAFTNLDIRDETIEHSEDLAAVQAGLMTRNEWRKKRHMETYPGLDDFSMPADFVPIAEADTDEIL